MRPVGWYEQAPPRQPLGKWLLENIPRGLRLDIPSDRRSEREIPFSEQPPPERPAPTT